MDKEDSYFWATKELQHDKEQEAEEGMSIRDQILSDPMFVIEAVHQTPTGASWDDLVLEIYKQMDKQQFVSEQDAQRMYSQIGKLLAGRLDEYLEELEGES